MQKCIRVISNSKRYECFNVTNTDCVVQKERPYDPAQVETELTSENMPSPTATTSNPTIPLVPEVVPIVPPPTLPLAPYNPYLFGGGTGGLGFNLNLNYNQLMGWGLNSNLGIQLPWGMFLSPFSGYPSPYYPYANGMMSPFANGMMSPYGSPFGFRAKRSATPGKTNAVRVTSCVPSDPWPDSSSAINDTQKR